MMKYFKYFFFIFLFYLVVTSSTLIKESTINSLILWITIIVPSLFPVFIVTDLLINSGLANKISEFFSPVLKRLFNISKKSCFVIVLSMFSGNPTNARLLKKLLDNNEISTQEGNYILSFTSFANPIFVYNVFGLTFFRNYSIGIILLLAHYTSNFIIGFVTRPNECYQNDDEITVKIPLTESVTKNVNIMLNIAGYIVLLNIIKELLVNLKPISFLSSYPRLNLLFTSIFEFVSGIKNISTSDNDMMFAVALAAFVLSFAGIAIQLQVYSLIHYYLDFKYYFFVRIVQGLLSFLITIFAFEFIYVDTVTVFKSSYSYIIIILVLMIIFKQKKSYR
ncbi:nucleoside recognition domain-containing protein [Mycoplasmatota bacterium WC44]